MSFTCKAQLACGLGAPTHSTRHMRQLPATDSRSWKQNRGISAPACSQACNRVRVSSASISLPSTISFLVAIALLRRHPARLFGDALFNFGAEMADEPLDRPGRRIAQGADGVAFHFLGHF